MALVETREGIAGRVALVETREGICMIKPWPAHIAVAASLVCVCQTTSYKHAAIYLWGSTRMSLGF